MTHQFFILNVIIAFSVSLLHPAVVGLRCRPCDEGSRQCPDVDCPGSQVPTVCGCCFRCAKQEGETCGGSWGISGECDHNLICHIENGEHFGFEQGTCIRDNVTAESSPDDRIILANKVLPGASGRNKLLQIPLSDIENNFTVFLEDVNISATAVHPVNGDLYWCDRDRASLFRANPNFTNSTLLRESLHVKSMAIDPLTGNIYYADACSETINVIDSNGHFMKALTSPPTNTSGAWKLETVALDIVNKHLYWINNNVDAQQAELRRMGMDGKNQTLVLGNLNSTKHILISNEGRKMYLTQQVAANNVFDSARLYEIPLSSLSNFSQDDPDSSVIAYPINFQENITQYIQDFVVSGSRLFMGTKPPNGLQSVNLERSRNQPEGANIDIVQAEIGAPLHISLFSSSEMNFTSWLTNDCQDTNCTELCLLTPQNGSMCACRDGFQLEANNTCRNSSGPIDLPPSYNNTCPDDFEVTYLACQPSPTVQLRGPQWTDDHTAVEDLHFTGPNRSEQQFPDGQHDVIYTAEDSSGNVTFCSYVITVTKFTCRFVLRNFTIGMFAIQTPHCREGQLVAGISCPNKQVVKYGNQTSSTFLNYCQSNLTYTVTDYSLLTCVDPPTTTETPLTSSSTNEITVSPSGASTPETSQTSSTTETPLTSSSTNEITVSPSGASIPETSQTSSSKGNATAGGKSGRPRTGGLAKGAIVGIIVVILIVFIIVAAVLFYKYRRNRPSGREDRAAILTWENSGDHTSENAFPNL